MKIHPEDWVIYTLNPCGFPEYTGGSSVTQCFMFKTLPEDWQYRLNRIYGHYNYSYHSLPKDSIGLRLHAVLPPYGVRHSQCLRTLFKDLDKPIHSIFSLPSGDHWLGGDMPKYEPADGLNGILGFESKKILMAQYLNYLCEHIKEPKRYTGTFPPHDQKNDHWRKDLLKRLKKLEGRPMKANEDHKQFLVELSPYDMEKKKIGDGREYLVVTMKEGHPTNAKEVTRYVKHSLVKVDDPWCITHDILYIEEEHYVVTSGHVDFTEDRLEIFSNHGKKEPLSTLDMTKSTFYNLRYNDEGTTGVEIFHVPVGTGLDQILSYYQQKYPNKKYERTLKDKAQKIVTKETTKKKQELPKKGETPAKLTRKVCYKHKDSDKIYRDQYKKVKSLVEDDEDYSFVTKKAWKTQRVGHRSNITLPNSRNLDDLGDRARRRAERELKHRMSQSVIRSRPHKISEEQRVAQSTTDREKYVNSLADKERKPRQHMTSRCFQAVILGPQGSIDETIQLKAVNEDHAKQLAGNIQQIRGKPCRLNGVVKDWIKQTGKNRK